MHALFSHTFAVAVRCLRICVATIGEMRFSRISFGWCVFLFKNEGVLIMNEAYLPGAEPAVNSLLMNFISFIIPLLIIILIYFIPTFIAKKKNHRQKTAIIIVNVFLGWTFLGWVVALVWSVMKDNDTMKQ